MYRTNSWIAHFGLCAAAAVLVSSLSVLFFGAHGDARTLRNLGPAQIHVGPSLVPSAGASHAESSFTGARADASDRL
jgi:hypothetical protein